VGEHGAEGDVADAADVRDLGTVLGVDDHAAALVELEADVLEAETTGVGAATDRNKDDVSAELQRRLSAKTP
jgi:hypothetical protein